MSTTNSRKRSRDVTDLLEATKVACEALELQREGSPASLHRLARLAHQLADALGSADLRHAADAALATADPASLVLSGREIVRRLRRVLLGRDGAALALVVGLSAAEEQAIRCELTEADGLLCARGVPEARRLAPTASMVVLDLMLPDLDGRDLLLEWAQDPNMDGVPVVVVAPASTGRLRAECLALGAAEVLERPLTPASLVQVVLAMVGRGDAAAARERVGFRRLAALAGQGGRRWTAVVVKITGPDHHPNTMMLAGRVLLSKGLPRGAAWIRWADDAYVVLLPDIGLGDAEALLHSMVAVAELRGLQVVAGGAHARGQRPEEVARAAERMVALASASGDAVVFTELEPELARRILVVEDDDMMARLLQSILEGMGLEVTRARDGQEGLDIALKDPHDLVLLDIEMPRMDGLQLLGRLRATAAYRNVPIAMCTSLGGTRDIGAAMAAGADDYIVKPFGSGLLETRIRALLARPGRDAR